VIRRTDGLSPGAMRSAILRIFAAEPCADGTRPAVGVGFLVDGQLALTCAHVLRTAFGLAEGHGPPDGATIQVDAPLLPELRNGNSLVRATVEKFVERGPAGEGDIAVLRLDAPIPGTRPVHLAATSTLWNHMAGVFGLPGQRPDGVWHSGLLKEVQGNGWIQMNLDPGSGGYAVSQGFSGAPVWDETLGGVVGMMVATEAGSPAVSYLIPTECLVETWPGLREVMAPISRRRGQGQFDEPVRDSHRFSVTRRRAVIASLSIAAASLGSYGIASHLSSPTPQQGSQASLAARSSPVAFTAEYMASFLDGDGTWVLPTSIGSNPLAVVSGIAPQISALAPGMGGKVVSPAKFRMTLDDVSRYSVTVVSMRARILQRSPDATGILVQLGGQGAVSVGEAGIDLDSAAPYAEEVGDSGRLTGASYFASQVVQIDPAAQYTIDLTVTASKADYLFELELDLVVDGRPETWDYRGPGGKPFQVTGRAPSYKSTIENNVDPTNEAKLGYATP
jgi:hypothetical protein